MMFRTTKMLIVKNTLLRSQFLQVVALLKDNEAALGAFLAVYMPLFKCGYRC